MVRNGDLSCGRLLVKELKTKCGSTDRPRGDGLMWGHIVRSIHWSEARSYGGSIGRRTIHKDDGMVGGSVGGFTNFRVGLKEGVEVTAPAFLKGRSGSIS
jgi:hypothetical protein